MKKVTIGIVSDLPPENSLPLVQSIRDRGERHHVIIANSSGIEDDDINWPGNCTFIPVRKSGGIPACRWQVLQVLQEVDPDDVLCFVDSQTVFTRRTNIDRFLYTLTSCDIAGGYIRGANKFECGARLAENTGTGVLRVYPGIRTSFRLPALGTVTVVEVTDILSTFYAAAVRTYLKLHEASDRATFPVGLDLFLRAKSEGYRVAATDSITLNRFRTPGISCASSKPAWEWPSEADMIKVDVVDPEYEETR